MIDIVQESGSHVPAREALLDAAFGPSRRGRTSERLREGRHPAAGLSLSALDGGRLVGTVRLWHVGAGVQRPALLLGPLAVEAGHRGRGLGGALMRHAIAGAAALGHRAVLLVGDALYYERFGFSAAPVAGLFLPGPHERDRFLGLELEPGALLGAEGLVRPTGALLAPARQRRAA
jgi:predicted N-acetyltransferase YhbS